jgi:hypothetical protein
MVRLFTTWLVPVAFTLLGFGLNVKSATAQIINEFSATYDVLAFSRSVTPGITASTLSGTSSDAPYGLTTINGLTYSVVDPITGFFRFNTDPTVFGLQDIPSSEVVFGSGTNKLFGTDSATGIIDFTTLTATATGIFTITGGEGIFTGATGTLNFSEVDTLSLDPTIPTRGRATVNGRISVPPVQKVPEPTVTTTLLAIGLIASSFELRKHYSRNRR